MGIVLVALVVVPNGSATQAVTHLPALNQTGFLVIVRTGPVAVGGHVDHAEEIPHRVVMVALKVAAHGLSFVRMHKAGRPAVVPRQWSGLANLADVFASFG